MDMGLHINLRIILLALGALFVLAILFDGLRRKYRRNKRFSEQLVAEYSAETFPDDVLDDLEINTAGQPYVANEGLVDIKVEPLQTSKVARQHNTMQPDVLTVYMRAQADKPYIGYELLQALLSTGLRFGAMSIFHRHQETNGQGPIWFSLANAQEPGTFDIHNMGAVSCSALTLFVRLTDNKAEDVKHLDSMLETAHQLTQDLGGTLLDNHGQPFSVDVYTRYRQAMEQRYSGLEAEALEPLGI